MQIENHKEEVPFAHYEGLFGTLDPQEAAARTGVKWDGKEFYVNLLGWEFGISHPEYAIRPLDGGAVPPGSEIRPPRLHRYAHELHDGP